MPAWWPHLRTALVLLHVVAITLMAVPSPSGGMNRQAWKDPTVQGEFAAWTARVNALGIDWTQQELEERAWAFATRYTDARQAVLKPFRPYHLYMGTWQSWRMFVAPHRYPNRLEIELLERGQWRKIYVARSSEHAWRAQQFDHDRMRAFIFRLGWKHYRKHYTQFGEWVANQAAQDFPDAKRVRLSFYKYKTLSAQQVRAGEQAEETQHSVTTYKLDNRR